MDSITAFAVIAFAALIHASFQLSISVLTLLSGHALGAKHANRTVLKLTTSFVGGAGFATVLLLATLSLVFIVAAPYGDVALIWTICCGLLFGVAIAVWLFYFRRDQGTTLWVPRRMAAFLDTRSKKTKQSAEAFSLGLTSVVGELLFIIAPLAVAAFAIAQLPPLLQLVGIVVYAAISLFSLVIVWALVGGGHKLSRIQKWRETHKHFLQFSAAGGLIVLGFYVYVNEVLITTVGAGAL